MTGRTFGTLTFGAGTFGALEASGPAARIEVSDGAGGWLDVTCDARTAKTDRGRSSYLEGYRAGTAEVTFSNHDDRFSAWNVDGVWSAGGVYRLNVPIRLSAVVGGAVHVLFTGTTDQVIDTWPGITDAVAEVSAVDGFKGLARHRGLARTPVGDGELSGARINRLADDAGFAGGRDIDAGLVTLTATDLAGVTLDAMQEARECEYAALFIDEGGTLVFRQRDAIQTDPRMANVQWCLTDTDAPGDVGVPWACYADLKLASNDHHVYNRAQVTRTGGTTITTQASESVAWFGPYTWTRDNLPLVDDADSRALGQVVVLTQAYQDRYVESVSFDALASHGDGLVIAADVRLNDRIRLMRTFPGGHKVDAELLVQAISHELIPAGDAERPGRLAAWLVTLSTADAVTVKEFGQWDVALWDVDRWGI